MKIILLSSLVFLSLCTASKAQNFTLKPTPDIVGLQYSSVDFADIDGDGDLDLFTGGADPSYILTSRMYKNDGSGNFTLSDGTTFIKIREGAAAFGDVNGDNFPDLVVAGNTPGPTTKLYINNGSGNYSLSTVEFTQSTYGALAFGDIDNDGDNDLVVTGFSTSFYGITELYKNDGNGNFTLLTAAQSGFTAPGVFRSSVVLEDFDGDGFLDVFVTGNTSNNILVNTLYKNNGNGSFTIRATPIAPIQTGSVSAGDFDNDGDKDLLVVGADAVSAKVALLYSNDGNGNFTLVPDVPFIGAQYGRSVFADVNNDGYPDVFISGYRNPNRRADLYMNNGASGGFTPVTVPFQGLNNADVAFADVDGDTDLDFLVTGLSEAGTISKLFLNELFLGTENPEAKNIRFYPNPVAASLYLTLPSGVQALKADVYSLFGQLVHSENFADGTNPIVHFDALAAGVYLMKVTTDSGTQIQRIVKS